MTERNEYHFAVKEFNDGTPWIAFEPLQGNLAILKGGMLGFDLREGTTLEEAHQLASLLHEKVNGVSFTPR